jgi:hypothetical protein
MLNNLKIKIQNKLLLWDLERTILWVNTVMFLNRIIQWADKALTNYVKNEYFKYATKSDKVTDEVTGEKYIDE